MGNFRYLKYACIYDAIVWYRCPNSDEYYAIQKIHSASSSENSCYKITLDLACPNDKHFYQPCGHDGCSGHEVRIKVQYFTMTIEGSR